MTGWAQRDAERSEDDAEELDYLRKKIPVLIAEREQARASLDRAVKLLTEIHFLLYPTPITTADGRTMAFRPKDPDPHTVLQALSDRIRALPDELDKLPNVKVSG